MTYNFSWWTHGSFGTLITLYTWITITSLKFKTLHMLVILNPTIIPASLVVQGLQLCLVLLSFHVAHDCHQSHLTLAHQEDPTVIHYNCMKLLPYLWTNCSYRSLRTLSTYKQVLVINVCSISYWFSICPIHSIHTI